MTIEAGQSGRSLTGLVQLEERIGGKAVLVFIFGHASLEIFQCVDAGKKWRYILLRVYVRENQLNLQHALWAPLVVHGWGVLTATFT